MDPITLATLAQAVAVVVAVGFGIIQMREFAVERMNERESHVPPVPAHVQHRSWKPPW